MAPLKVTVLGNSVARMVVGGTGPTFPAVLAERTGARVDNRSRWYELLDEGSHRFRFELRSAMPDVLVVCYGAVECQPAVVPMAVGRHFMTWDQGLGPVAFRYRRHVATRVWPALRRWQRWAAPRGGTWRVPPHRFAASLQQLVETARHDQAIVLVLDVLPFGGRMEHFLPGLAERRDTYQAMLAGVVASFDDPDVRLVRVSDVVDADDVPDGLHLSPEGHGKVADVLAQALPCTTSRSGRSTSP